MKQKQFPCTCSSNVERLNCDEVCDGIKQIKWVEEKWTVFREFDSEEEAKTYASLLGGLKIEKR